MWQHGVGAGGGGDDMAATDWPGRRGWWRWTRTAAGWTRPAWRRGEEKAKVFKNRFRSGGEENERRMANNVMRGRRVYDRYLVCLELAQISPAMAPEILLATS